MRKLYPSPEAHFHGTEPRILAKVKRTELRFELLPTTRETELTI